jgi:hypothetical protein
MMAPSLGPSLKKRPVDAHTGRDYAEPLSAKFNLKIQCDHFGNGRPFSMKKAIGDAEANPAVSDSSNTITMESHSHFSDDPKHIAGCFGLSRAYACLVGIPSSKKCHENWFNGMGRTWMVVASSTSMGLRCICYQCWHPQNMLTLTGP